MEGVSGAVIDREVEADKVWSVEQHAIEPIPDSDRHGSPGELFRMWIGANTNYVVVMTGALAITSGLSFWGSILAILIGNILGCIVVGLSSIMGPATGSAAIVTSRPSFGQLGAMLPTLISTLSAIGWFSVFSMVATESLIEIFKLMGLHPGMFLGWVAMGLVLVGEIIIAVYGHATIIRAEKIFAAILVIFFTGLLFFVVPQVNWHHALMIQKPGTSDLVSWLTVVGLIFSYPLSWTNFASDYSRYLPRGTSWKKIALSAGGGQFVALTFCEVIGVIFAIAVGGSLSDPVSDLPQVLPMWYLAPFLLAVILASIACNVPNGYTASLGLVALRLPLGRIAAMSVIAVITLGFRILTMESPNAMSLYQTWLGYILIWTCPWVAIVVIDYFIRGGRYEGDDLMRWGSGAYWYKAGLFFPGIIAFIVGIAVTFAFSDSSLFVSPMMKNVFGGADFSFESGLISAGAVYYLLTRRVAVTVSVSS